MQPITIRHLNFAYPGQKLLFNDCNLDWNSNWKLGLLGRNGRGKTTLMKILLHKLNYQGTVTSQLKFSYFPLKVAQPEQLAGQALLDALGNPQLEEWQVERELGIMKGDSGLLWQPYATLSGGEQTKLQLAVLFAQKNVFMLLDEPTNHLDQNGRQQLADYLASKKQGFIITSHDQAFLDQIIDHCLVIEQQQLVLTHGNYSAYFNQKARRDQEAIAKNNQLKKEIGVLKQRRQRQQQWAQQAEKEKQHNAHADTGFLGAKAARLMKRATTTGNRLSTAITQKKGLMEEVETIDRLPLNFTESHHQQLLNMESVSLGIDGHQLFQPLSFQVNQHDQVALLGNNGTGKSSLIRAINNTFPGQVNGQIHLAYGINVSYVRQNYSTNYGLLSDFAQHNHLDYERLLTILRKLGMERNVFSIPIEKMSMGQQKKVELAQSLATPAHLYIWDEPLNYLDTYNQEQLIQLIKDYQPPLLFVEHDRHFIDAVASKRVVLKH